MNQVTLCGYLTKDFEEIQTQNTTIARNFLAISEIYKSKEANTTTTKEYTDFIPIVLFGKKAEIALKYLSRGDKFLGTGKIKTSSYTDESTGQTRYTWQVIINQFEFVNGKKPQNENHSQTKEPPKELNKSLPKKNEFETMDFEDDSEVPF